jgi:quercetin dioxygenase-like cupin family protein
MKIKTTFFLAMVLLCSALAEAQVQVSKEPRHKPVLQNKYIRLLDVWLQPGDTTLFHIHSTPSVFIELSDAAITAQSKGEDWVKDQSVAGKVWYRSFSPDVLIHRVSNLDSVPFHVNDIEILSTYNPAAKLSLLPFPVLFENDSAVAYQITKLNKEKISNRGPLIAEAVAGNVIFNNSNGESQEIKAGKFLYIKPGTSFYFSTSKEKIKLVLFEIK